MRHGGDLDDATRRHGDPPGGWLDMSTGINPRAYPIDDDILRHADLPRLPSAKRLDDLAAAARRAYGAVDEIAIAAAPGAEMLIRNLPGILAGRVLLRHTAYRSYREAYAGSPGFDVVRGIEACAHHRGVSVILVNPNNPDGGRVEPDAILSLARSRAPGAFVVVDESYADAETAASIVPQMRQADPIIVLKSFGKFFGLPGLRLGFAIGHHAMVGALARQLGDWPVSGAAIAIGSAALGDDAWQGSARLWLAAQSQALDAVLRAAGLETVGGCRLFRAVTAHDARRVHERLARRGIWTRVFKERPDLIRFGLPPDDAGLARLADALAAG